MDRTKDSFKSAANKTATSKMTGKQSDQNVVKSSQRQSEQMNTKRSE